MDMESKLVEVPESTGITKTPKLIDFTQLDLYPSKYKYVDGKVIIKSLIIEDIVRQNDILVAMNTTVLINDLIKVDFKFGHFQNGEWIDLYCKGIYKVKKFSMLKATNEILMLVSYWGQTFDSKH